MSKHKSFEESLKKNIKNPSFKEAYEHYYELLNIGLKIRKLRLKVGFTQKEIADKMNVSQQLVARLEKGECNPTLKTLTKIAAVTGKRLKLQFS